MDELTRERFGKIPWRERYARPTAVKRTRAPKAVVSARRITLCGTDDLTVKEAGGDVREFAMIRERRLVAAIRSL